MEIREGLLYAKSHEWVKEEGDVVTIGLTDYAQSELGDLVFVNLPEEGDSVSVGEAFGDVESVKAVSDVYSPEIREGLLYAKSHEWVKEEGDVVTIGLTDYAQSELGDLVFVNLPEEGDSVSVGEAFGDVESVKAVSDVYSPVSGVVCEINEELLDAPESINGAPYDAWFIKVKEVSEKEELLSPSEYEAFVASEQ